MKRYFIFMAIVLGIIAPSISAQTAKQKVAVYVTGDAENGYKKVIGSKLVTSITRSDGYAAVERTADFLAELTKEQDYQMSGAVSDNQIARLGQQFGVRYVLVADISEIYESMFISARMIDVQTAQITNSTETSGVVSDMESLSKLAENIALEIVGASMISEDAVKQISVSTFDNLKNCRAPSGYHIATYDEILKIIKNYQMTGKKVYFPIYTDIRSSENRLTQTFTIEYLHKRKNTLERTELQSRDYMQHRVTCGIIIKTEERSILNLEYNIDRDFIDYYNRHNKKGYGYMSYTETTNGLLDMSTPKPNITPGYVYFIKNE